jgi:hypothetical protein
MRYNAQRASDERRDERCALGFAMRPGLMPELGDIRGDGVESRTMAASALAFRPLR